MSMFTLAISCLTTSNLPWFMGLILQVHMHYCSFQHQTLLPSPVTSTTWHCFHFGSVFSFCLELFLHSSPVAYWVPTELGSSSFSVLSFCLFLLFMGLSRQESWSGLLFPSPLGHVLSELSTLIRPPWVALPCRYIIWRYIIWSVADTSTTILFGRYCTLEMKTRFN